MYLKEVRINGFKSFADYTQLSLEPGVTAIVGPNGCGKSNIADCIRWVLGEQSAKALRGGKMQDVIFEGTDKRKPHSLCEVSLIFSDCEAQLGEGFHEVEIKRSVVRDGASNYYINGKSCRLKDIGKLFMDTGVGQVSYSFMVQGQIDQILSSNPSERRTIFEEAAGITRYKSQRKEALNKLSHVDANLARVTDVIEEVSRQIGSLRRQASKALRYKRVSHRLKHLDLSLSSHEFCEIQASLNSASQHSKDFTSKVEALRKSVNTKELGTRPRHDGF
jgi:chromosome segregation protein